MHTSNQSSELDLAPLVPAHDWCDGKCQRCPLRTECPLPNLLGDDTDELPAGHESLYEAIRSAGLDYSIALAELVNETSAPDELANPRSPSAVARHAAAVIGIKAARIAEIGELDDPDQPSPENAWDVHLNLLLIERLSEAAIEAAWFIAATSGKIPDDFLEAHSQLFDLLAPLFEQIPAEVRARLDALIQSRRAPSPFCVNDAEPQDLLS